MNYKNGQQKNTVNSIKKKKNIEKSLILVWVRSFWEQRLFFEVVCFFKQVNGSKYVVQTYLVPERNDKLLL